MLAAAQVRSITAGAHRKCLLAGMKVPPMVTAACWTKALPIVGGIEIRSRWGLRALEGDDLDHLPGAELR